MDGFLKNVLFVSSRFIQLTQANETDTDYDDDLSDPYEENDKFESLYKHSLWFDSIHVFVGLLVVTLMTKRKVRYPDCCGGHFGLAIPTNFLEGRKRRKPFVAAFALASIAVIQGLQSMGSETEGQSASVKIIIKLFMVSVLGCQFLPLFACIYMGSLQACVFGLIYHVVLLGLNISMEIPAPDLSSRALIKELLLSSVVVATAGIFLAYWFIKRIVRYYKNEVFERSIIPKNQVKYVRSLFLSKDRYLMLQKIGSLDETKGNKFLELFRKHIYQSIPGFRYSLTILVSCTIGFLIITHISIMVFYGFIKNVVDVMQLLDQFKPLKATSIPNFVGMIVKRFSHGGGGNATLIDPDAISLYDFLYNQSVIILVVSVLAGTTAYVLSIFSICRLMTSYRKNVMGLSKQKQNQLILTITADNSNVSVVRSAIQYGGYQVAYLVAGFSIQLFALNVILFVLGEIIILPIQFAFWSFVLKVLEIVGPIIIALIFIQLTQYLLIRFYFLEDRGKTMALDNRRGFFIMSYFVFFYNIFTGIFSCVKRILKGAIIGTFLVSRLDTSVFPRIFENHDSGFKAYSCLLHLEALQSNPVVLTFVTYLTQARPKLHKVSSNYSKLTNGVSLQSLEGAKLNKRKCVALNRWFVAYTLIRNPSIIFYRGHLNELSILEVYSKPITDDKEAEGDAVPV